MTEIRLDRSQHKRHFPRDKSTTVYIDVRFVTV